ncbi:MAG: insulinase family protein, partial [Planctomycetes bacterium]|nr:insulinase family protein [Planctomycetota bacterium]
MNAKTSPTCDVRRPTSKAYRGCALIGVTMSLLLAACAPSRTDAPSSEQPAAAAAPQPLAFPEDAFRAKQPQPATMAPFAQPRLTSFALENGIRVHLVERHALPTVTVELVIEGGGIDDPPGKEGLASLSLALMGEGTQTLDKLAFREALADLASNVSTYANADQLGVSMSSLTRCVDATLDLWADTL